jgi:hypothetical protein
MSLTALTSSFVAPLFKAPTGQSQTSNHGCTLQVTCYLPVVPAWNESRYHYEARLHLIQTVEERHQRAIHMSYCPER